MTSISHASDVQRWAGLPALLVLCLVVGFRPAAGQEPAGEVSGTVVEAETGRPVAAAAVSLEPRGGAAPEGTEPGTAGTLTAVTDARGRYRFQGVPPGWYRLDVSRLGYRSASLWIELPESWRIRRSLGLEVEPVELRAVQVDVHPAGPWPLRASTSAPASASTTVFGASGGRPTLDARALTPDDVERAATLGEPDVLRALQRLPGASGRGDFSAGVWTRGAPWGMTQILVDGLPLYHPLHFGGAASGVAAEGLEAVLFLPGVRPAALAEGSAGVVNLVTRRAGSEGSVSAGLSPMALRSHAEGRWLDGRLGVSVTGRRSWWDVVTPPRIFAGEAVAGGEVDYWLGDVFGRVDYALGDRVMLEAGGLWEEDRVDGDIHDIVAGSEGRWGNRVGWVALAGGRGAVRARLTAGRTVHTARTRAMPWASFYTTDGRPTFDRLRVDVARSLLRMELGGATETGLEWSAGLERARETLSQLGADAVDRGAPGVHRQAAAGWARLWGQGSARLGPADFSAGLSWDVPAEGDVPGLGPLPNVRVRVHPHDRLTFEAAAGMARQFTYPFALAGRSFGPALAVDHVWMIAGDGRSPLTSDVRTLAGEWRLGHGFGATVTAWRRDVEGLSMAGVAAVVDGALVPMFEDGPEGSERARGVEAVVWRRSGRIRGELGYSRGRAEIVAPGGHRWASPSDRRHSLDAAVFGYVTPDLRLGALLRSESGWPYATGPWVCAPPDDTEDCETRPRPEEHAVHRAPGYESLDFLVDWTRRGETVSWGVALSLRNALGRDNHEAYRPQGCPGAELISVACERLVGPGEFQSGLTRATPALALQVVF